MTLLGTVDPLLVALEQHEALRVNGRDQTASIVEKVNAIKAPLFCDNSLV